MTQHVFSTNSISVLAACLSLSACTNISGLDGRAEYGCKAPQGVRCESVSGNYYNALQNNLPAQRERRERSAVSHAPATRMEAAAMTTADTTAEKATSPSPLRAQARVLRLWFKPWEDADHDLVDQGFVYVQVDPGRWLIDHVQQRIRDAYAPVLPPRAAALPTKPATSQPSGTSTPGSPSGPTATVQKPLPDTNNASDNDSQ